MAKKIKFDGVIGTALQQKEDSEAAIKQKIIILEELRNFIPPLSEDEFAQLEENIVAEGCRDALILWKQDKEYILVDGHNRHKICTHHNIDFRIELKNFQDVESVKEWMINNQLGKRNIPETVKSYLRGQRYQLEKRDRQANLKQNQSNSKGQDVPSINTAKKLAEEYKVSEKTIKRDQQYTLGIDKLVQDDSNLKWKILNKDIDLPKNFIVELLDKADQEVQDLRNLLKKGKIDSVLKPQETASVLRPQRVVHPPTMEELEMEAIRSEIVKAFKLVVREKDREALGKMRILIDQLEKRIFG